MNEVYITRSQGNQSCYAFSAHKDTFWESTSTLLQPLPHLFLQIALLVGSNLLFLLLLKNLNQPRIVRDLISALVVSPFILRIFDVSLSSFIWPRTGNTNLRALGNLGIIYSMFIKGLQMDLTPLTNQRGNQTLFLSCGIILIPFFMGCALYNFFSNNKLTHFKSKTTFIYWGAVLATSSFPTLASILSRLKLLSTNIGRESLCICMINDLVSWALMVFVIALSTLPFPFVLEATSWEPVILVLLFTSIFGLFCYLVVRPCIEYYIKKRQNDGENYQDSVIHFMLISVMVCGLVSEFFGACAFLGAFILGLVIPHGVLSQTLVAKTEDFVSILLMPLYYASIGVRLNDVKISTWVINFNIALVATILKPLCVFLFSLMCRVPCRNGFALAVLLNAKGLHSVSIAVIGFDRKHLTKESSSVLILMVILSTITVGPIMSLYNKRVFKSNRLYQYNNLEKLKPYDEFRVVACIQETQNIPGMLNLLEISNHPTRSPMSVFGVHLMELIGKVSAMLIVHQASGNDESSVDNHIFSTKTAQYNKIASAFDNFKQKYIDNTTVQALIVVSPMDSMHEDITNIAEDKEVCMIMLSYHKHLGMDGRLEDGDNVEFQTVNLNVMRTSPCSVGLLIDRNNGIVQLDDSNMMQKNLGRIAMLYFGGPDDREALTYALRLSRHMLVNFTLIRFIIGDNPTDVEPTMSFPDEGDNQIEMINIESEIEKIQDGEFIERCLKQSETDNSMEYVEIKSNNGEETTTKLKEMDRRNFDLYVVGRGEQVYSSMTVGLAEWNENPELGVIGEVLVMSDFMENTSVLVIQQSLNARRRNKIFR